MGFKEIRTSRAAPGVHIGDRLAIFKRIDRGVLLRIQRALDLPGGLRAGIYDMQGKYPVLRQGWQRDENKNIKNRERTHTFLSAGSAQLLRALWASGAASGWCASCFR